VWNSLDEWSLGSCHTADEQVSRPSEMKLRAIVADSPAEIAVEGD
jgi:hypothetical protein